MTDQTGATQEIAKTVGKAIDAGNSFGQFFSRYFGGTIEQATGIYEDKLKYIRWERQIRLFEKATELLKERGIDAPTHRIPLHIAIPLLTNGSLTEDDYLQDKWATLLVNSIDCDSTVEIRHAFISILNDLTQMDALILEKIYKSINKPDNQIQLWTTLL